MRLTEGRLSVAGRLWLGLMVSAGGALRFLIALQSPISLLGKNVPDDAYYYFSIARSVAAGLGPVSDGLNPTNGFHPLWLLLIVPLFRWTGPAGPDLPINLALILCALLDLGAGLLLCAWVARVSGRGTIGILAAALYLLNPIAGLRAVSGMETALTTFLFASVLAWYAFRIDGRRASLGSYAVLGLLSGLLVLARTDSVLVLAVLAGYALRHRPNRESVQRIGIWAGLAVLVVLPWWIWSLFRFGTFIQVSGVAYPYAYHVAVQQAAKGAPLVYLQVLTSETIKLLTIVFQYFPGILCIAFAVWVLVRSAARADPEFRPRWRSYATWLAPPVAGILLLAFVHTWVRWYPREHYFLPVAWLAAAALALCIDLLQRAPGRRAVLAGILTAAAFVGMTLTGYSQWTTGAYPWQPEMYQAARWLEQNTGPSERSSAFNSGIIRYYSNRVVVDLDGVVNAAAFRAIEGRSLGDYALKTQIHYLADFEGMLDRYALFWGGPFRATRVLTVAETGPSMVDSHIQIYRLDD